MRNLLFLFIVLIFSISLFADWSIDQKIFAEDGDGEDASGKKVSSGIYLYELKVNSETEVVKKCLLMK
jgi:hypothetical protein